VRLVGLFLNPEFGSDDMDVHRNALLLYNLKAALFLTAVNCNALPGAASALDFVITPGCDGRDAK
jgi:hypothetical protein